MFDLLLRKKTFTVEMIISKKVGNHFLLGNGSQPPNFSFGTLQALGSRQNPRSLEEDEAFFFTMRSKDSETIHLQAAVRCCVTAMPASTALSTRQTCT